MSGSMKAIQALCMGMSLLLVGCGDKEPAAEPAATAESKPAAEPALVTVNGAAITETQLDYAMTRTLGESAGLLVGPEVRDKVLQSLVQSRAIAQQAQQELSAEEAAFLEEQVRAYREELLVKRYLQNHADPQPVSNQQVTEYYNSNPELFGGEVIRTFEYITSVGPLADLDREQLKAAYQKASASRDWKQLSATLVKEGFPVKHKQAEMNIKLLPPNIKEMVTNAKVAEGVEIHTRPDVIMLRVLKEQVTTTKPLQTVSAEIRKTLAHKQMKEAVKSLASQVMSQAQVDYATTDQQ